MAGRRQTRWLWLGVPLAAALAGGLYFKALSGTDLPSAAPPAVHADDAGATSAAQTAVVAANSQFAWELYGKLHNQPGNLFFSPASISTALAMVYEGAAGQTAEQMQQVLHVPADAGARRPAFAALHNELNAAHAEYELQMANALWAQRDYPFLPGYTDVVKRYYAARATNLDFSGALEPARRTINDWTSEQTRGKIPELFAPGTLDDTTRLVLTNAIYFKGKWVKPFSPVSTQQEEFHTATATVNVPLMRYSESERLPYAETADLQLVELPYKGDELSMLILLPKAGLPPLEAKLSAQQLSAWRTMLQPTEGYVYLPRFRFNTRYTLNDTLRQLGMGQAFDPGQADLSGMDGTRNLYLQLVVHQAYVAVDEQGTEAAAATGAAVGATAAPLQTFSFRADHPFIFIIQQRQSGNILFIGRVENPTR